MMNSSAKLIEIIKLELKASGMTYAALAEKLGMAESSVKRMLAVNTKGDISLTKIDAICQALKIDFVELARRVADAQELVTELTIEQERSVVADPELMLVAICVLSLWTLEQIVSMYRLSEAQCIGLLTKLDRIGFIELRPLNRYTLKLAKTFKWQPHGPVMQFFREHAVQDYFAGGFNQASEGLLLVHGQVSAAAAPLFLERLQRLAQDFSNQHLIDQKLKPSQREGYTLLLAMRQWDFAAFEALKR
jgi:transcriptional regulator with XRE-family HTH domain